MSSGRRMERQTYEYNFRISHQSPAEKDVIMSHAELMRCLLTSYSPTRTSARRPCYKSVVVLGLTGVTSFSGPISSQDLAVSKGQRSKVIATLTGMLLNSIGSRFQMPESETNTPRSWVTTFSVVSIPLHSSMTSK